MNMVASMVASTVLSAFAWAGIVVGVLTLLAFVGTNVGRGWVKKAFKGQSIEQITSDYADRAAEMLAAYQTSEAERKREAERGDRLEARVAQQDKVIAGLQAELALLRSQFEGRDDIKALAALVTERHVAVMHVLNEAESNWEAQANRQKEILTVVRRIEKKRAT